PETLLVGVLSDSPDSTKGISRIKPTSGDTKVATLTVDDIPDVGTGLISLDVLMIADTDTGKLSDAQRVALKEWVTGGGRLIIIGGPGFQPTLAGLQDLAPFKAQS